MKLPEVMFEDSSDQGGATPSEIVREGKGGIVHAFIKDELLRHGPYEMNIASQPGSEEEVTLAKIGVTLEEFASQVPGVGNLIAMVKFITGQKK